jgi:FkbM family methyltransferase
VEERAGFFDSAEELTPFLGAWAGSGVYLVRTRDKHIGRSLFAKRGRGEMHVLTRAVTAVDALYGSGVVAGKTFIDIGANIGTTTVPAVLDHGFAFAVAVEPEEENFVTLRLNAVLNGVDDRIATIRKAASNQTGTSDLVVNPERGGKHWIATDDARRGLARKKEEIVTVETVTIDQLAEDGVFDPERTGMLWIDAQGHEGHIIEGATALTAQGVPIVLEWDPAALDKVGDRGKIQEVAERDYTHFAGMRADPDPAIAGPKLWLRPVDELDDYAERFLDESRSENFTDIMLLRLASDQVPDDELFGVIDMSTVIKRQARLSAPEPPPQPLRRLGRKLRAGARRLLGRADGDRGG